MEEAVETSIRDVLQSALHNSLDVVAKMEKLVYVLQDATRTMDPHQNTIVQQNLSLFIELLKDLQPETDVQRRCEKLGELAASSSELSVSVRRGLASSLRAPDSPGDTLSSGEADSDEAPLAVAQTSDGLEADEDSVLESVDVAPAVTANSDSDDDDDDDEMFELEAPAAVQQDYITVEKVATARASVEEEQDEDGFVEAEFGDEDTYCNYQRRREKRTQPSVRKAPRDLPLDPEVKELVDTIMEDIEDLVGCVEQWVVADIICITTGVVRTLPQLLHYADDVLTPELKEQRQSVVDASFQLTSAARNIAKSPQQREMAPQVIDTLAHLSTVVGAFVSSFQRACTVRDSTDQNQAGAHALLKRIEATVAIKRESRLPESERLSDDTCSRALSLFGPAIKQSLAQLTSAIKAEEPAATEICIIVEQLCSSTVSLVDVCDSLVSDSAAHRELLLKHLVIIVNAVSSLAEPVDAADHLDRVTTCVSRLSQTIPSFSDAVTSTEQICRAMLSVHERAGASLKDIQAQSAASVAEDGTASPGKRNSYLLAQDAIEEEQEDEGEGAVSAADDQTSTDAAALTSKQSAATSRVNEPVAEKFLTLRVKLHCETAIDQQEAAEDGTAIEYDPGMIVVIHDVKNTDTVYKFKEAIEARLGIPADAQHLVIQGSLCSDNMPLHEAGADPGKHCHLFDQRERPNISKELYNIRMEDEDRQRLAQAMADGKALPADRYIFKHMNSISGRPSADGSSSPKVSDKDLHSMKVLNLVKLGKVTVEQAAEALSGKGNPAVELALRAQEAEEKLKELELQEEKPKKKAAWDDDDLGMSIAAFEATKSMRRPKSGGRVTPPQFVREGRLVKEGGKVKTWKERWFVLTSQQLCYTKQPHSKSFIDCIGLDSLARCAVVGDYGNKQHCFALFPKAEGERVYYISANSDEDMQAWVRDIDTNIPGRRPQASRLQVLQEVIARLQETAVIKEDVLRVPGNLGQIKQLLGNYEQQTEFELEERFNPHTLVGFLKRAMAEDHLVPLVPISAQQLLSKSFSDSNLTAEDQIRVLGNVVQCLAKAEGGVLRELVELFGKLVEHGELTNTTSEDVARAFGGTLFGRIPDDLARTATQLLVDNYEEIFFEV